MVAGVDEVVQLCGQLGMAVIMIAFDHCLLDHPVHPFHLTIGPGVLHPGQAMSDAIFVADPVENVVEGIFVADLIGGLDAVVAEHDVDGTRHGRDQVAQELGGDHLPACCCNSTKANLLVRSLATNRRSLRWPSIACGPAVCTSAMSMWK